MTKTKLNQPTSEKERNIMATGKPTPVEISTAERLAIMVETAFLRHASEQNITIYEVCCDNLRKAPAPNRRHLLAYLDGRLQLCGGGAGRARAAERTAEEKDSGCAEWEAQKAERKTN
jgi:hypothetical protein